MKFVQVLFILACFLFSSKEAWGYPAHIGLGYASCLTCHYNPLGNGPINSYGRAVQATEISGNLFRQDLETLGNTSGFLYTTLPQWLQLQGSYRGLYLARSLQANPNTQWITMQAEGSVILSFSKKLMASGTVGYVPLPSSLSPSEARRIGNLISREHYVGYRPQKGFGLYVGLMDTAFGLRIPDHNAFIRSNLLLNVNDQTHGVLIHRDWDKGEISLHAFIGRLSDEDTVRQKGGSLMAEFEAAENFRLGGSVLYSASEFRKRQLLASHARLKIGNGSSVLGELGVGKTSQNAPYELFSFLQSRHLVLKGLYGLMTFETYGETLRGGPSVEYLPFPKLEIRLDLLGAQSPSSLTAQLQTHIWL